MLLHSFQELKNIPTTYVKVGHFTPGIDALFPRIGVYSGKRRIVQNHNLYLPEGRYNPVYSETIRKPQVRKLLMKKTPNFRTLFSKITPIFVTNRLSGKLRNRICLQFLPENSNIVEVKY